MSILIKCMEIPKSCGRCWFNNSSLSCAITGSCIDRDDENRERLDDCPLVDLGKHGRLVDADAIVNAMNDMKVEGEVFVTAVNYVKLIMNDADTIVEAEEEA